MLSVAAADPLMLDLQVGHKAALQLLCPPSPPLRHSLLPLQHMNSPPQPQHQGPAPAFQLLQSQAQQQPQPQPQPFHSHSLLQQQQHQHQHQQQQQQQAAVQYAAQQQQPMPHFHFIQHQQPQAFFLAPPHAPPSHFPRQLSSPVSVSNANYSLLPAQPAFPRTHSPQPARFYTWQQQQQQQQQQMGQPQPPPSGFFTSAPPPGSTFTDSSGAMYVMSGPGSSQTSVMTTAASQSVSPSAMLMPPPPAVVFSSPQHLPQQPHPGMQARVHSAPVLCHPVSMGERQHYAPQPQQSSVVFSPMAQPAVLEYSREQPLAALCVKYEYHSIIECGVVDALTGSRRLTQHCPYFGKEVECFTAVNDPHRTVLYRVSALAAKIDCATNKVGMYLARRRSLGSGIYQATAFRFKPAGRSGLKCGGYFLSLEACKDFEDHFVPKQPIILHAAAAAAADSTDSASNSSNSRSASRAADSQQAQETAGNSSNEEKKEVASAAATAAAMEEEGGQLLKDRLQS